jgi:DNA-binding transcriptional ArsR family regulator
MADGLGKPFGGLFGDTAELRVMQEIVADPYSEYTQQDLMRLTGLSDPSVRRGLSVLLKHGVVENISRTRRRPRYRPNTDSKLLTALTFLAYAVLDEAAGSDSMDEAVRHYCELSAADLSPVLLADGATLVDYVADSALEESAGGAYSVISERV